MVPARRIAPRRPPVLRRSPHAAAALAAALCAGLAGCGGAEPAARAEGGRAAVTLDDFHIEPQRLRARAGRVTFAVRNEGRLGHNFHVQRRAGEALAIPTIFPGRSVTETVRVARGEYRMVCTVANHAELGMTGVLVVR